MNAKNDSLENKRENYATPKLSNTKKNTRVEQSSLNFALLSIEKADVKLRTSCTAGNGMLGATYF